MPNRKIDKVKLAQLFEEGKSPKEIAVFFGCSTIAVYKAKKQIQLKDNLPVGANQNQIAIVNDLTHLRRKIRAILEEATKSKLICPKCQESIKEATDPDIAIKASREIRGQMRLEFDLAKAWVHIQAVEEWKREILNAIDQEAPAEIRNRIINRIKSARLSMITK